MNNIPVFFGQGGTASLVLREIPFRKTAYILLRTVLPGQHQSLVTECAAFCRSAGAEHCFASGEGMELSFLPHAYDILLLHAQKDKLPAGPDSSFTLVPMDEDNEEDYQRIYNVCFGDVSHAAAYDQNQIQRIHRQGQRAYVALDEAGTPCGIGELHGSELAAVGLLPAWRGEGTALTLQLLRLCDGPEVMVTVASDNDQALRMYDKLGFLVRATESRWYKC